MDIVKCFLIEILIFQKVEFLRVPLVTGFILVIEPRESQVQITAGAINGPEENPVHTEISGSFISVTRISPYTFNIYLILIWTHK